MSLANTTWTYSNSPKTITTLVFGENKNVGGSPGGYGTSTLKSPSGEKIENDIIWMEDGNGNFMFQIKGPTDKGVNELPTVTGVYKGNAAIGWGTNFDAIWGIWDVSMTKQS